MFPRDMVCLRNISVDTLHKGDTEDDDDDDNNNNNNNNKQNSSYVPVISSTGVIPKSLAQSLKRLNLHPNTYIQMQKSVILGTCSIVKDFLNYK
jgi:hypothetical protein